MKGGKAYRGVGAGHARPANCRKRCAHPLAPSARVTPHSVGRCREATEGPGPEGLRPQAVGERTVRLPEIFRVRLPKNACRGEHCSPLPVCLARNYSGKCISAVSWRATNGRPYTRNKAGKQFFDGLRSGQDRSLQLSRQRCGGYNKVGGNKKSHHGRWWEKSSKH